MKYYSPKVVIVWSGAAGLRSAIHMFENGFTDVLVVGDRKFDDAHTTQARGGINAAAGTLDKDDSPLIHAVDTFREWQFLANPYLVETLTRHSTDAIDDLIRWWANFHKEADGITYTQRFFWAHSYRRTFFSGDETGKEMIRVMTQRARELEIPFLEDTYVHTLITDDWVAKWIEAINKANEDITVTADIVLFACWGYANVYFRSSSRNKENFWDAIGVAYRAGATIWDIEMVQFHPTWLLYPEEKFWELVTEAVRWEWWKLFNAQWERFMWKYDEKKWELSTRDVVARANFSEIHEGRGTEKWGIWLDISHKPKDYILERLPKMHSMILEYNSIDISENAVEIAPTTHYTMGGIWFDHDTYETSLKNFYVAWECSMWVHGANRLWGNSLMETLVFWKKVAEKILKDLQISTSTDSPRPKNISQLSKENLCTSSLKNCTGLLDPQNTLTQIRKLVWEYAGIVRNEKELQYLQEQLAVFRRDIASKWLKSCGNSYDDIVMHNRVETVLDLAELICFWALERTESRGAHYRSDYPNMSQDFHKNLIHTFKNNRLLSKWKEIPQASPGLQYWLDNFEEPNNYWHSE